MIKETRTCPRCGLQKEFFTEPGMNATSRLDTETEICQVCQLDESIGGNTYKFRWAQPIPCKHELGIIDNIHCRICGTDIKTKESVNDKVN